MHLRSAISFAIIFASYNVHAQWNTIQIPLEQDQVSGVGNFSKVFVTGGTDYMGNPQYLIQEYDRLTGAWSDDPLALNNGRIKVASAIVGNRLLCAGGWAYATEDEVGAIEIYDLDTRQLIAEDELSDPRVEIATAVIGNKVLFAGGIDATWTGSNYDCVPSDVIDIYDATSGNWTVAQLSVARGGMASAVLDGKAYFAGGYTGSGGLSDRVDIYDAANDSWSIATLSTARAFYGGGVAIGGKVMFAGGITGEVECTDVVDVYDPVADVWSTETLSVGREGIQATTVGNYAIFAGGGCGVIDWYYTTSSDVVDIYDAANDTWSSATMSSERINFLAVTSGNQAFLIGGYDIMNDVVPLTVDVFTDASTIGINEHTMKEVAVWPNPFTDHVNIGALEILGGCTAEVFDAQGRIVATQRLVNTLTLDLAHLLPGAYAVRLGSLDGQRMIGQALITKLP